MNSLKTLRIHNIFILGLLFCGQLWANDYETGRSAYISGDYDRALQILKPLAVDGDPEAQKIVGIMYDYGHGIEKDLQEALYWYIRSAEQGNPLVQYQVGAKYFHGYGTERDYEETVKWWGLAANGGQVDAQFNLGLMYYRGLAMERDNFKAAQLFQRAAEQGHSDGQYVLGLMYAFGQGVDKNYDTAFEWFKKSSEQGVARAQYNMGVYYENGYSVEKDMQMARKWYGRASAQGLDEATKKLLALTQAMDNIDKEIITATVSDGDIKREAWVLDQASNRYTLQIVSLTNEADIINFIRANQIETEVAYIEVVINGVTRYNAIYGVYRDFNEATNAISTLPAGVRKVTPWIRNFGMLQKLLN